MRGPKRTPGERERDLERLAELYCRGLPQLPMAQALGVSRQQVGYDLKKLMRRWQESALANIDAKKAEELAKLNHLEAIAWAGWERSGQDTDTVTSSLVKGRVNKNGESLPDLQKATKTSKVHTGDPRFLEMIFHCINKRCDILGLKRQEVKHAGDIDVYANVTETERRAIMASALAEIGLQVLDEPEQAWDRDRVAPDQIEALGPRAELGNAVDSGQKEGQYGGQEMGQGKLVGTVAVQP